MYKVIIMFRYNKSRLYIVKLNVTIIYVIINLLEEINLFELNKRYDITK